MSQYESHNYKLYSVKELFKITAFSQQGSCSSKYVQPKQYGRRKIRLIEGNLKCRHLKHLTPYTL
jgi:hypothetical protein